MWLVLLFSSEVDVKTSDGEKRRLKTGDVLLVEDTKGKGHKSRAVEGKPRRSMFIALE